MDSKTDNIIFPVSRNRILDGLCLYCGEELLGESEMGLHHECRKKVEKAARKQIAKRKERDGKVKRIKVKAPDGLINKKP